MCTCHYKLIIEAALSEMDMEPDEIGETHIAHDVHCAVFRDEKACCNCRPRISLQTKGGEVLVTEEGEIKSMSMQ